MSHLFEVMLVFAVWMSHIFTLYLPPTLKASPLVFWINKQVLPYYLPTEQVSLITKMPHTLLLNTFWTFLCTTSSQVVVHVNSCTHAIPILCQTGHTALLGWPASYCKAQGASFLFSRETWKLHCNCNVCILHSCKGGSLPMSWFSHAYDTSYKVWWS